ncbi:MAG: hypothetical protein ACKVUT_04115 [Gaiella sp.]
MFSRRNAFLGWLVWTFAKRRLRKKVGQAASGAPSRGRFGRLVAIAAGLLAVVVAAARKRSSSLR